MQKISLVFIFLFVSLVLVSATVVPVSGSSQKICQLIGDTDRQFNQPTSTQTGVNAKVLGTDLGVSFASNEKLIFLFGDTITLPLMNSPDSIAYTSDYSPNNCIDLNFYVDENGKFKIPEVPGISLKAFEVPMEGVEVNGQNYVFFTTDSVGEGQMGRSVITKFKEGDFSFDYLYDFSTDKFINVHIVKVDNSRFPGLPESSGKGLLIYGSGVYRQSNLYLSYISEDSLDDKSQLKYFSGIDNNGNPQWSSSESDAVALFNDPVIGEFSIQLNPYLNEFIVLYSGVSMRSTEKPWGKWSESQKLFNAQQDGYCKFIHAAFKDCDSVSDPTRESTNGGPYGPYLIDEYTTGNSESSTIYYTLSTWNPYTVVLMKSEIKKSGISGGGTGGGGIIPGSGSGTGWKPRPLLWLFFIAIVVLIIVVIVKLMRRKIS